MVREMIKKASKIARIELDPLESERLTRDLERILDWIGELPEFELELNRDHTMPREDIPIQYPNPEKIRSRFPRRRGDYCMI